MHDCFHSRFKKLLLADRLHSHKVSCIITRGFFFSQRTIISSRHELDKMVDQWVSIYLQSTFMTELRVKVSRHAVCLWAHNCRGEGYAIVCFPCLCVCLLLLGWGHDKNKLLSQIFGGPVDWKLHFVPFCIFYLVSALVSLQHLSVQAWMNHFYKMSTSLKWIFLKK